MTKWYNKHFKSQDIKINVVLLTDDADNRKKAEESQIPNASSKMTQICFTLIFVFDKSKISVI